ncbi:MAG TPA: ROK family protein [Acidimicrobiia bacterium]|nr:ROK family protein [Acidimicrobiia bacterium]
MTNVLGIDIGGTGIKGAPVDPSTGQLTADRFRIPTPQPATPTAVAKIVGEVAAHFEWKSTDPVGATFPAVIKAGVAYTAANVDKKWIGTNAGKLFGDEIGAPVTVVNDADAAGVAEMEFGAGKGVAGVVIMVTLGTGIGSAVFVDGDLVPNTELGHMKIGKKDAEKLAAESVREAEQLTWKQWAERLDNYFDMLERLFSPDLLIVGGGVSKKADKFLPLLSSASRVVPAQLLNEAGIVGAAINATKVTPAAG